MKNTPAWENEYWALWQKEDDLTHIDDDIKSFIHQLLKQQKQELIEEIKNRRQTIKWLWDKEDNLLMVLNQIYKLEEFIKKI